jgi:hypothetical protein
VVLPTFWLNKKLVVPPMYRHPPSNKNVWKVQPSRSVARAQQEFSSSNWSQDLLDGLLDILALAGWSAPSANQKCLFEEQFPPLFNATGGVCKTLGEDITSFDMEVATVGSGTIFKAASMSNGWPASTNGSVAPLAWG